MRTPKLCHEGEGVAKWPEFFVKNRYVFLFILFTLIFVDYVFYKDTNASSLYTLLMLVIGLSYKNHLVIFTSSVVATTLRFTFAPVEYLNFEGIFLQWFTYLVVGLAVSILIQNHLNQKASILHLTLTLAKSLDSRDRYTAEHSLNVARYSRMIAERLGLTKKECKDIYFGGLLHDIGKIGVPESILTSSDKLTNEEYEIIKTHPEIGFEMIKHIPPFQKMGVLEIVRHHHERFDGKGYPDGLSGEDIPLCARIAAIADTFDAVTTQRSYRAPLGFHRAMNIIAENKGSQFDPYIADVFLDILLEEGEKILKRTPADSIFIKNKPVTSR